MKKISLALFLLLAMTSSLFSAGSAEVPEINKTYVEYVDNLDRALLIPEEIASIAPSGNVAQMALYALAPEKLAGWSSKLNTEAKNTFLSSVSDKPVFGTFYGKKANLNKEALMASGAELVLDIGDIKPSKEAMTSDLDTLSSELGIPVLFLTGEIEAYPDLLDELGAILGKEEEAAKLSAFAEEAIKHGESMREKESLRIYYSVSDDGLEAVEAGSSHSELLEFVGCENVVPQTFSSANGLVSLESIYQWNPDVILLTSEEAYNTVMTEKAWSPLDAVKNKRVYLLSANPYPLIDRPTSIQRLLGIYALDAILYGNESVAIDKAIEYYDLFYHVNIDEEKARAILSLVNPAMPCEIVN